MAKLVRGIKTGFLNLVGALKCGGRPATVEAPISTAAPAAGKHDDEEVVYVEEAHNNKVLFAGGAREEDLFVGEAEFKSVHQVMRIVQSRDVGGAPKGSKAKTG